MSWKDLTAWVWMFFLSEWTGRLVMLVVVPIRRTPTAAKGWLLIGDVPSVLTIAFHSLVATL